MNTRMTVTKGTFAVIAALALSACSHTGSYNASYFEYSPQSYSEKISGIAAIEMTKQEQAEVFSGNPTSFTGAATTLNLPIGQIVREGAVLAFRDMFSNGAEVVESSPNGSKYAMTFKPRVRSFSYEYNQLKNAGFAITPTAAVAIEVSMKQADGKEIWTETADSGAVEGPVYFASGSPGEEITKVAHKAVLKTLQRAASSAYAKARTLSPSSSTAGKSSAGEAL